MKFSGVFTGVLLLASSFVVAQDVTFGIKGGVNVSNVSQEDLKTSAITSFHIGGVMEARYSEKIALQPEILFSFQGFDYINEFNSESNFRFTYINLPVMVKYYVIDNISLEVGPQLGYRNTAKLKKTTPEESTTTDIKYGLRSNDLSINMGVSFYLFDGLNIGARYSHGLTNITDKSLNEKFKNRVLQVSIGYLF